MTSTRGSVTPTAMAETVTSRRSEAGPGPRYVQRFTLTERLLHWVHASAFFVLLGSGLVMYIPALATIVGRRPLIKDVHFYTGISWLLALAAIALLGNRRAVIRAIREVDLFDRDDLPLPRRTDPQPAGAFQCRPEGQRDHHGRFRSAVLHLGPAALARRAQHRHPPRRHALPPRRPDVPLGRDRHRPPLPRVDEPQHTTFATRNGPRQRPRGLGSRPPCEMARGEPRGRSRGRAAQRRHSGPRAAHLSAVTRATPVGARMVLGEAVGESPGDTGWRLAPGN